MSEQKPITDPDHLLPAHKRSNGPLIGAVIIILILLIGAFYFWKEVEVQKQAATNQLPMIPAGTTTIEVTQ